MFWRLGSTTDKGLNRSLTTCPSPNNLRRRAYIIAVFHFCALPASGACWPRQMVCPKSLETICLLGIPGNRIYSYYCYWMGISSMKLDMLQFVFSNLLRSVYILWGKLGITAETLGNQLLKNFSLWCLKIHKWCLSLSITCLSSYYRIRHTVIWTCEASFYSCHLIVSDSFIPSFIHSNLFLHHRLLCEDVCPKQAQVKSKIKKVKTFHIITKEYYYYYTNVISTFFI